MKKIKLKTTFKYSKKIALRFHDVRYYACMGEEYKHLLYKEQQKRKYSTPKNEKISQIIDEYKEKGRNQILFVNWSLKYISKRNISARFNNLTPPLHTNLHQFMSSVPLLIQSYQKIRKNKGYMTAGAAIPPSQWETMNPIKKRFLSATLRSSPDGINLSHFFEASKLIRKGLYPWGPSRRIYIDKPGQPDKKRPLTIPPFFDRIVQQSIKTVLETIYEPWFDKDNCSFGFRPGKGTHNAITALTARGTQGLLNAIEGDIKEAYDKVNKDKLVKILAKRIRDNKFLTFIKQRLNYMFYDTESRTYQTPVDGIPQGGIDSPYLFNIYMKEFDEWLLNHLRKTADDQNKIIRIDKHSGKTIAEKSNPQVKEKTMLRNRIKKGIKLIATIKNKNDKYREINKLRILQHKNRKIPSLDKTRANRRFVYIRYADDWIILTNASKYTIDALKLAISEWLMINLDAVLSLDKTLTTDLRKDKAHFLGFELIYKETRKLALKYNFQKDKYILSKVAGSEIKTAPDSQRLINRLFMKGYCDKKGYPITIPWLSCMEPFMIIERFNSVINGLANFYAEFISNKNSLNRWIYILRYSCLKTLAQKYKTSIKKLFTRYREKDQGFVKKYGKTIIWKLRIKHSGDKEYEKTYRLTTYLLALDSAVKLKQRNAYEIIHDKLADKGNYLTVERYMNLQKEHNQPSPLEKDYLDKIKWINWRTSCSFNLPCAICGKPGPSEMHHIKHVRKQKYSLIPEPKTWEKMMSLRNRKQIPVCRGCHMDKIHAGKYEGQRLISMTPTTLLDNRMVNIECYVNKSDYEYFGKSLEEKGFKLITKKKNESSEHLENNY